MPHYLVSTEATCPEQEVTWRELHLTVDNKDLGDVLGDGPNAASVTAILPSPTLRSLHGSCLCVHGLCFASEMGDTKELERLPPTL